MSDVNVYDASGVAKGKVSLPGIFETAVRPDLIRKAVSAARANRRQKYGASPMAGKRHSTASVGKGKGASRVPRLKQGNAAALAPPNVGGRRAHPPESRKNWEEKINNKERRLAIASALAASADRDLVTGRGHKVGDKVTLPVVVSDITKLEKTKDGIALLEKIGVGGDLERARLGRHIRAGIGKMRGRRYKTPKSALIVTDELDSARKAFGGIRGVDIVSPRQLSAEHLAPGGDCGRLVIFSETALKSLGGDQ